MTSVVTFLHRNWDWVGVGTSTGLFTLSLSDIHLIAQIFAAISATIVALITAYYRIKEGRRKDKE